MNRAIILGNLGADPDLRYTQGGQAVANFNVATSEKWVDKQGQAQEKTEWHRIVVWGKSAENCGKYLKKGRQVLVEGSIHTREWEDKDGVKKYTTEIKAQNVQFLGGGDGAPSGGGEKRKAPSAPADFDNTFNDDDIPF